MQHRRATPDDHAAVTDVIARVFADDPLWGPALAAPDGDQRVVRDYWGLFVAGALRYPASSIAGACDAVTVWIPPGGTELDEQQEADLDRLLETRLPGSRDDLLELYRRFDAAHPHDEPHYYLSLLATRPESRGRGIGMELLRADLAAIDVEGVPSYLESSNPANDERYARLGFRAVVRFEHPTTRAVVTGMWRDAPSG